MHNFNPHSHEGSDISNPNFSPIPPSISIHTPTKGATHLNARYDLMYKFQSTLPRRERPCRLNCKKVVFKISIHTPTKGATLFSHVLTSFEAISIHTPTKGATFFRCTSGYFFSNFNPHSHEGSDQNSTRSN